MNYWIYYVFADGTRIYCCRADGFRMEWSGEEANKQLDLFNNERRTMWYKEPVSGNSN